jgi:hypothetical protein
MPSHTVHRATLEEIEIAFALVTEYCEEMGVEVREDREQFEKQYFAEGAGVWLALAQGEAVGCVALRELGNQPKCGERELRIPCCWHWKSRRKGLDTNGCIWTR